jgi:Tail fiber protein.
MPNSIITSAGLALFARALDEGLTIPIDRMVFADISGLDPSISADPAQSMPHASHIVLDTAVDARGKIDEHTVVYSKILTASDGDYYMNWIGLYSSAHSALIAVCQVPRHRKYKTSGFQAGNTMYKNFAIQYANASALTGITIAPETWQYNYDDRYAMKAHGHPEIMEAINRIDHIGYTRMGDTNIELPEGIVGGIEYDEV